MDRAISPSIENSTGARFEMGFCRTGVEMPLSGAQGSSLAPTLRGDKRPQEDPVGGKAQYWGRSAPAGELVRVSAGASTVFLLADEPHALAALACILRAEGFAIRGWMSAAEFLDVHDADTPGCLITDVNMREISGLEVQRILLARGIDRPIIFITDQGDIRTTVLGMKAGAITFLAKPVLPNEVIGAVREAFAIDSTRRAQRSQQADFQRTSCPADAARTSGVSPPDDRNVEQADRYRAGRGGEHRQVSSGANSEQDAGPYI